MLNSRSRAALPSPRFFGADPMHAIAESPIYPHREDSMPYSLMAKVSDGNSPSRSVRAVRHPDPVFRNDSCAGVDHVGVDEAEARGLEGGVVAVLREGQGSCLSKGRRERGRPSPVRG